MFIKQQYSIEQNVVRRSCIGYYKVFIIRQRRFFKKVLNNNKDNSANNLKWFHNN